MKRVRKEEEVGKVKGVRGRLEVEVSQSNRRPDCSGPNQQDLRDTTSKQWNWFDRQYRLSVAVPVFVRTGHGYLGRLTADMILSIG